MAHKCLHSLPSSLTSLTLPQDICTGCSHCLGAPPPAAHRAPSSLLSPLGSLLKCHLLSRALPDHFIENSHLPSPSTLSCSLLYFSPQHLPPDLLAIFLIYLIY